MLWREGVEECDWDITWWLAYSAAAAAVVVVPPLPPPTANHPSYLSCEGNVLLIPVSRAGIVRTLEKGMRTVVGGLAEEEETITFSIRRLLPSRIIRINKGNLGQQQLTASTQWAKPYSMLFPTPEHRCFFLYTCL